MVLFVWGLKQQYCCQAPHLASCPGFRGPWRSEASPFVLRPPDASVLSDINFGVFVPAGTLADMNYDVYHGTIDSKGDQASQLFYAKPRFGECMWDEKRARKLAYMLECAVCARTLACTPHMLTLTVNCHVVHTHVCQVVQYINNVALDSYQVKFKFEFGASIRGVFFAYTCLARRGPRSSLLTPNCTCAIIRAHNFLHPHCQGLLGNKLVLTAIKCPAHLLAQLIVPIHWLPSIASASSAGAYLASLCPPYKVAVVKYGDQSIKNANNGPVLQLNWRYGAQHAQGLSRSFCEKSRALVELSLYEENSFAIP
eukprot:1157682-Pelagomonas_calceolata.AAC.4